MPKRPRTNNNGINLQKKQKKLKAKRPHTNNSISRKKQKVPGG